MLREFLTSLRAIVALTILTCVIYPLAVTGIGQLAFPSQANGSLIREGDKVIGSALVAQKFTEPKYFWPRPSAADYGTVASGASNQGFTSEKLRLAVEERRTQFGTDAPADMLSASGSGLDPHVSPETARYQAARVATTRNLPPKAIEDLIGGSTEAPQLGFLGQNRVNVLLLNQALDRL